MLYHLVSNSSFHFPTCPYLEMHPNENPREIHLPSVCGQCLFLISSLHSPPLGGPPGISLQLQIAISQRVGESWEDSYTAHPREMRRLCNRQRPQTWKLLSLLSSSRKSVPFSHLNKRNPFELMRTAGRT